MSKYNVTIADIDAENSHDIMGVSEKRARQMFKPVHDLMRKYDKQGSINKWTLITEAIKKVKPVSDNELVFLVSFCEFIFIQRSNIEKDATEELSALMKKLILNEE